MTVRELFETAGRLAAAGTPHAMITVVRTSGSTPRKPGAKMLVTADATYGSVGGGRIERELIAEARTALRDGRPKLVSRHLGHDLAMCCGGEMESFVEPLSVTEPLVLVGAGHIHHALAPIGVALGFDVVVADDLEELASERRFPGVRTVSSFSPVDWGVSLDARAYVVVATRDHDIDQDVLLALSKHPELAYVGVVGSEAKLLKFKKRLTARGVSDAFIASIHGPVGLAIGAETPEEIAVAIAAQLVQVKRRAR